MTGTTLTRPKANLGFLNVRDNGAALDGTTDDMPAIMATVAKAALVKGTVYIPYTAAGCRLGSGPPGGIVLPPNVSLVGDRTRLIFGTTPMPFITISSTQGTYTAITADTTKTTTALTVASTAAFTVGMDVLVQLGQAAYDAGEPDWWLFAAVLTITDATHLTLDRPVGYAMSVGATSNPLHRSVTPLTTVAEGNYIDGLDLYNPLTSGVPETGIFVSVAKNIRIGSISGENTGAGLLAGQYVDGLQADYIEVRKSIAIGGQASLGRGFGFGESRNINIGTAYLKDCEHQFVNWESHCRACNVENLRIENGFAGRDPTYPILHHFGGSDATYGRIAILGKYTVMTALTDGSHMRVGSMFVGTESLPVCSEIIGFDELALGNAPIYSEIKRYSKVFALTPSMVNVALVMPSGLYRRLRMYATSAATITQIFGSNGTSSTTAFTGQLVTNQQVLITSLCGLGSGYPLNDYEPKAFYIDTNASVPVGATLTIEAEYFVATGVTDDVSKARIDVNP